MNPILAHIQCNWRTTLAGICVGVIQFAAMVKEHPHPDFLTYAVCGATAVMGLVARDPAGPQRSPQLPSINPTQETPHV